MEYVFLGIIVAIGIILVVYGVKKKRMDIFVNYTLRMAAGILGIYLVNAILNSFSIPVNVGINTYNVLVIGLLGTPGFLLVYGVFAYFILKG